MASVERVGAPSGPAAVVSRKLTEQEKFQVQQYQKIIRLSDAILSGSHPTIKIPGLAPAVTGSQSKMPARDSQEARPEPPQPAAEGKRQDGGIRDPQGNAPSAVKTPVSDKKEIDPVLLEKSEELVRAEIMRQRQRLERSLEQEAERCRQIKASRRDQSADIDISDVLAKALILAPPAPAAKPAAQDLSANPDTASDSFDDNTFYSSQQETPVSQMASRVRNESAERETSDAAARSAPQATNTRSNEVQHTVDIAGPKPAAQPRPLSDQHAHAPVVNGSANPPPRPTIVPGLTFLGTNQMVGAEAPRNVASAGTTRRKNSKQPSAQQVTTEAARAPAPAELPRESYIDNDPPSPLIRNHAPQHVAPQPAQVGPLAVGGQTQENPVPTEPRAMGTPAQVAALRRHEASTVTSPDSSSQGGRTSEKRKNKKKKRKADRQAPDVEVIPFIKPEPRSVSPLTAPSYIRPKKRQRQTQGQPVEIEYEFNHERHVADVQKDQPLTSQYRDEMPLGYENPRPYPQQAISTAVASDQRYNREYLDERRIPAESHVRGYGQLAPMPQYPYSPRVAYPARPLSQAYAGDAYREPPRPFRDYTETSRLSVRPEGDAYAGQVRSAAHRVLVDAYGREYYDPLHPAVHRAPVPSVSPAEPGIVYERYASRPVSRHPGGELYGDGGVIYGGAPGIYGTPRRVVTQPAEYTPFDYRDGQHRDFPPRAMAPPTEFSEVGLGPDRRTVQEAPPRGFSARAASLMPMEGVRYEPPAIFGRVQSVRPEMPGPEYAPVARPEARRETLQPYMREYAPRPMEPYHRPQARGGDEIAFIERPRGATQEIVYADDARREVYR